MIVRLLYRLVARISIAVTPDAPDAPNGPFF